MVDTQNYINSHTQVFLQTVYNPYGGKYHMTKTRNISQEVAIKEKWGTGDIAQLVEDSIYNVQKALFGFPTIKKK